MRNPLERNKIITRRWRSKAYPLPHGVSPVSIPLIASQQGIHGKPRGFRHKTGFGKSLFRATPLYGRGHSRSRSAGAFPNYVTRFRGGALRHATFPKTSYKVQLLDTLKHAASVNLNRGRRRGLIFLSSKVLVLPSLRELPVFACHSEPAEESPGKGKNYNPPKAE